MYIHAEPVSYNIRIFDHGTYGDKYDWSCRADLVDDVVYLSLVENMTPGVVGLIRGWCRSNGIRQVQWTRYRKGIKKLIKANVYQNNT